MTNRVQYIFGVYNPVTGQLVGVTPSGNTPYAAIPGSAAIVSTFAALRLQLGSQVLTAFATGKNSQADGGGGTFVLNPADTTTGAYGVGSVSGSVFTCLSIVNGAFAVGQNLNRGDTGASVGTITSLGTGTGGTGTYNLSASATIAGPIIFTGDNNSTVLVGADGSRWDLAPQVSTGVGAGIYGTDSGVANAYVFTHSATDPPATLAVGTQISFVPLNTNTGPVTVNADGSGAVAAVRANGSACTGGEFSSLGPVVLQSTGTQWQIVSTAGAQPGYERTAAETSAAVIPDNYGIPNHITTPTFVDVDRYGINTTPGTTNMQSAFANALAVLTQLGGGTLTGSQQRYLITGLTVNIPILIDFFNPIAFAGSASVQGGAQLYSTTSAPLILNNVATSFLGIRNIQLVGAGIQVAFTASVGGATSGTLTATWQGTTGSYAANFTDGETRTVTLTNGQTTITWTGALNAGTILAAYVYPAANTAQDGIQIQPTYPAQTTLRLQNVAIFNMTRYGLWSATSYTSTNDSLYVTGCQSIGILDGPNSGSNNYRAVNTANNTNGIDCISTNGQSRWVGIVSETNYAGYGLQFGSGCVNQRFTGVHTEGNVTGPVKFQSGSDRNVIEFEQFGSSVETAWPVNSGGNQNHVLGWHFGTTTMSDAKPLQRVTANLTANVNGAALTATPYSNTLPTTAQGKQFLTLSITPLMIGNHIKISCESFAEIATAGTLTTFLTVNGIVVAAEAHAAGAAAPVKFSMEYEFVSTNNTSQPVAAFASSSTAADTVTVGGHATANVYGGAQVGILTAEEWLASS